MLKTKIFGMVLITALMASMAAATQETQVRRYLLSAGANNGGKDRVLLRYAVTDAKAFAAVLTDMGGVDRSNAVILSNPGSRELLGGISDLGKLIARDKSPDIRHEVFIYYSGHADVDGLKLGSETLRWEDFRNAVNSVDAEIRVAVLDACGSGAITRTKGGISRPAFLADASTNMKGYAFLTSSNENEASQESDRIKGSYFTHALLSGMRGAADLVGDGKVTINEAYQYAFNETLRSTQNTSAGAQHPSRDMNLAGTGDIVMTDLRETSAILSLDADIEGRFFIRDASGNLFTEINKMRGRKIELGIPPGKYSIQMEAPSRMWVAGNVVITEGGKTQLSMNDMKAVQRKSTVSRGGGAGVNDGSDDGDIVYVDDDDELIPRDDADSRDSKMPAPSAQSIEASLDSLMALKRALLAAESGAATPTAGTEMTLTATTSSPDMVRNTPYSVNACVFCLSLAHGTGKDITFFPMAQGVGQTQFGVVNLAEEIDYLQLGVVNAAKRVGYVQVGNANFANSIGVQWGNLNIAKNVEYVQMGTANAAADVKYLQFGVFNYAHNIERTQLGVLNTARQAGLQFGDVNIAAEAKRQIGVLNIAKYSEKTPVGILSIAGNGIYDLTGYADATGDLTMSLRTGMPWFYNLIEYSSVAHSEYNRWRKETGRSRVITPTGYGLGTRFGMNGRFTMNLDFVWRNGAYDMYKREKIICEGEACGGDVDDEGDGFPPTVVPPPGNGEDPTAGGTLVVKNANGEWELVDAKTAGNRPPSDRPVTGFEPPISINVNIKYNVRFQDYCKLRLGASYAPLPYIAVTGGMSLNAILNSYENEVTHEPAGGFFADWKFGENDKIHARVWPGIYAGVTVGKITANWK